MRLEHQKNFTKTQGSPSIYVTHDQVEAMTLAEIA